MGKQRGPGKPFVKGQRSANPKGSSKLARIKAQLRGMPLEEVLLQGRILMEDTDPDVCARVIYAPESALALRLLATMADEALAKKSSNHFNALFDRVYGKAKESVSVSGDKQGDAIRIDVMSTEQKLERLAQLRKAREGVAK